MLGSTFMTRQVTALRIKGINVDPPLVLAPMAGVSDGPFRMIVKEYGCGLMYGEMVNALGLLRGTERSYELLEHTAKERPLAVQIFGSDADALAQAACKVAATGADMVDINCGCPVPKVVRTGAGAALMRQPVTLARIIAKVRKAYAGPLSIKIRKGWNEQECTALTVARMAVEEGVDCIAVHGRSRSQSYQIPADWDIIAEIKRAVPVPVIGNGDVNSPAQARRMLEETGCDAIMIGRAAQGNPWIFQRIAHYLRTGELLPQPTAKQRVKVLRQHLALMVDRKGESLAVIQMRKHAAWYIKGPAGSASVRSDLVRASSVAEMNDILGKWLVEVN